MYIQYTSVSYSGVSSCEGSLTYAESRIYQNSDARNKTAFLKYRETINKTLSARNVQ